MKNSIKYIALLLAFICLVSPVSITAQEEERELINTYEYLTLKGLGATNSEIDALYTDSTVTRAQYAYMLAHLMGYKGQAASSDEFIDVKNEVYKGAIYYLKDNGIVSGVNSYQFKPDDSITLETALIMSVRAMGYENLAEIKYGTGANAMIMMASSIDLTVGLSAQPGESLTAADACLILKNTATEPMLLQVSYGDDQQFNSRDNTILSEYCDITYSYGIMTDNGITALDGASQVSEGRVVIDGVTLINKDFDGASALIGKNVEFYYTKDNHLVYASEYDNELLVIDAHNLETGDISVNSVAYYTDNGKRKTVDVDINANLIYNGYAHPYFTSDDLKITDGQLIFVNNDSDSGYEVIIVREYADYVVSGISDGKLIAGNTPIDLEEYSAVYLYNALGEEITADSIAAESIATVYESYDKKVIEAHFRSEKISGTVSETGENEQGEKIYVIGDTVYTASSSYEKNLAEGALNAVAIDVGGSYMFSLNIFGKIVKAESIYPGEWRIGYCVGIKADTSSLDDKVRASLVMSDGTLFQPYFADKVSLNESSKEKSELLLGSEYFFDISGTPLRQPVKIKLDGKGNITEILAPQDKTTTAYGFDTSVFSYDKYVASGLYRGSAKRSINNCILTNDTVIFEDPYYGKEGNTYATEDIKAYDVMKFPAEASVSDVRFFDLDEGMRPEIMVYRSKELTPNSELLFVENVSKTLDKFGNERKRISGYSTGVYKVYLEVEPGVIPDSIKRGDVCKFAVEGTELASITKVISLGENTKPYADGTVVNAKWANIYGYLYTKTDNSVVVVAPDSYKDAALIGTSLGSGPKVTVYDLALDKIYPGTMADVYTDFTPDSQGDYQLSESSTMVYIHRQYDYAKEIIVVRK